MNTFDLDFVRAASEDPGHFYLSLTDTAIIGYGWSYSTSVLAPQFAGLVTATKEPGLVSEDELKIIKRGYVGHIYIRNEYESNTTGETEIELDNLILDSMAINNISYKFLGDENMVSVDGYNWLPVIKSGGLVTIGMVTATTDFTTDVKAVQPYSVSSTQPETVVWPLFIDSMLLSNEGKTLKYDMNHTSVSMLSFLGGEVAGSKLDLNTGKIGNGVNYPRIGIANIMGGKLDMSSKEITPDKETISELRFYEGNPEFRFADENGNFDPDSEESYVLGLDVESRPMLYKYNSDEENDEMNHWLDLFTETYSTKLEYSARTNFGIWDIGAHIEKHLKIGSEDMSNKSQVGFYGQNLSLGDIKVSKNLSPLTDWMDGSCNFYQHGTQSMSYSTITK